MRGVRRGIAGALLLGLIILLVVISRLDEKALARQIISHVEQISGRTVQAGKVRLSLQHGLSLKLAKPSLRGPDHEWWLAADSVRFDVSIMSLFTGQPSVDGVDLVHPVLHLASARSPSGLFSLPLTARLLQHVPIVTVREGKVMLHDAAIMDQLALTMRRNSREEQTTWELQSRYAGGDFTSHGYIRSSAEGDSVFGRITGTRLQLAKMSHLPLPPLHYDRLNASLTFSLDAAGEWQWSGNLLARDEHGELPDLSWRGKINGRGGHDFTLHDAYARFGDKTRMELAGGCEATLPCQLELNTRKTDAGLILKALKLPLPLAGKLDSDLDFTEQKQGWQLDGKLALRDASWEGQALPDSVIDFEDMRIRSADRIALTHAEIRPQGEKGKIEVDRLRRDGEGLRMTLRLRGLHDAWQPIGRLMLAGGEGRDLSGNGPLDGVVHYASGHGTTLLRFALNGDQADIRLGKQFAKPAGVAANVQGYFRKQGDALYLELGATELGSSRLQNLSLSRRGGETSLSFSGARFEPQVLKAQQVLLPQLLRNWQGTLAGSLSHARWLPDAGLRQGLGRADGQLQLNDFGHDGNALSGVLRLQHGRAIVHGMHWQRGEQSGDFDADVQLATLHGRLDVQQARLAWNPSDAWPAWLQHGKMVGRFAKTDVRWEDNLWKEMRGRFTLQDDRLLLSRLLGEVAGGTVRSTQMLIEPLDGGVRFAGQLGMTAVRLGQLNGLEAAIGSKLGGYAFVNARVSGLLPAGLGAWQGNGDVELQHARLQGNSEEQRVLWLNRQAAAMRAASTRSIGRISSRFRIGDNGLQLSRIHLQAGELHASGEAKVASTGEISGQLAVRQGQVRVDTPLGGHWVAARKLFGASAAGR